MFRFPPASSRVYSSQDGLLFVSPITPLGYAATSDPRFGLNPLVVAGRAIINAERNGESSISERRLLWGGHNIWSSSASIRPTPSPPPPSSRLPPLRPCVDTEEKNTPAWRARRDYAGVQVRESRGNRHIKKELWVDGVSSWESSSSINSAPFFSPDLAVPPCSLAHRDRPPLFTLSYRRFPSSSLLEEARARTFHALTLHLRGSKRARALSLSGR